MRNDDCEGGVETPQFPTKAFMQLRRINRLFSAFNGSEYPGDQFASIRIWVSATCNRIERRE